MAKTQVEVHHVGAVSPAMVAGPLANSCHYPQRKPPISSDLGPAVSPVQGPIVGEGLPCPDVGERWSSRLVETASASV
jgi:hypothetical protein